MEASKENLYNDDHMCNNYQSHRIEIKSNIVTKPLFDQFPEA